MKHLVVILICLICTFVVFSACSSREKELLELALKPPDRKPLDRSIIGVNNFFVDSEFGSIDQQFSDIRSTLGIRFVRILAAWTTDVQPNPRTKPTFDLLDKIISKIPPDVDVLIVVSHAPNWMLDANNWTADGNPRHTWVENWLQPLIERYAENSHIIGWEIWNEPDLPILPGDNALGLTDPVNYFELLTDSSQLIRQLDPSKLVVIAATQSIQQDFPNRLHYNEALKNLGAENLIDIWNIHYYGKQFERAIEVADFLRGISLPIWITESGQHGPNEQLSYVETTWPFLKEKIPHIQRIYYYKYDSLEPITQNLGLRTTDTQFPVSDLYVHLRDG